MFHITFFLILKIYIGQVWCGHVFNVPQDRFMLMLVIWRYTFLSGHLSQFCLTDKEAITLIFLFPISLRSHTKVATVAHGADGGLHIFTEANADINDVNRVHIELKAYSQGGQLEPKQSFWGTPAVTSNKGGVGLMCDRRIHDQVKRMPATTAARKQWQGATRLELFRVAAAAPQRHSTDKGTVWPHSTVVYGVVGNRLEADRLLRKLDTWVKEIGHHYPLFVVGDFNMELLDSQVLMEWAAGDALHDLHAARAARCGTLPGPTTDHQRIDYVWANAPAREAVADFPVEDIFATHRSLRIRLHLEAFTRQKLMRYKPVPLDTTPRISLSADTIMNIFSRHTEKWEEHIWRRERQFLQMHDEWRLIPCSRSGRSERSGTW